MADLITCEPGTTTPARWGAEVQIEPAGSTAGLPVATPFAAVEGRVELGYGDSSIQLSPTAWAPHRITVVLPTSAPGVGPFTINVDDGSSKRTGVLLVSDLPGGQNGPLPVPGLLALFRLKNFDGSQDGYKGAALIVTELEGFARDDEKAIVDAVDDVLVAFKDVLNPTGTPAGQFASYVAGVDRLANALPVQQSLRVWANPVDNLKDVRWFTKSFATIDALAEDIYAEDTISSLIFLGPTGAKATFYDFRDRNSDGGRMEIEITDPSGVGAAVISNLHSKEPKCDVPGASVNFFGNRPSTWGDMIGSVEISVPDVIYDPSTQTFRS